MHLRTRHARFYKTNHNSLPYSGHIHQSYKHSLDVPQNTASVVWFYLLYIYIPKTKQNNSKNKTTTTHPPPPKKKTKKKNNNNKNCHAIKLSQDLNNNKNWHAIKLSQDLNNNKNWRAIKLSQDLCLFLFRHGQIK